MKAALIYGYAEGPKIAKKFCDVLACSGHQIVDPAKADVIFAHSGGSFMVPANNSAKLVILIDVPYYDSHWSFTKKLYNRVIEEGLSLGAVRKLILNTWYVVSRPKRSRQMYLDVIKGDFTGVEGKNVLLVRNDRDLFGILDQDKEEAQRHGWIVESLPGTHDDLWINPDPYIKLAEKHV